MIVRRLPVVTGMIAVCLLAAMPVAHSQGRDAAVAAPPAVLASYLYDETTLDQYLANVADVLRRHTTGGGGLDAAAIEAHDRQNLQPERRRRAGEAPGEIRAHLYGFLALDLDGDGVLTPHELEMQARRSFDAADTNRDGVVSRGEAAGVKNRTVPSPVVERALVKRTVAMLRTIEAAKATFQDSYGALPGDFDAQARMGWRGGNGDGRIGASGQAGEVNLPDDERYLFWLHLRQADLFPNGYSGQPVAAWGQGFRAAPIGGGFHVYHYDGQGELPGAVKGATPSAGLYVALTGDPSGDLASDRAFFLSPARIGAFDAMMDDGRPDSGFVIAAEQPGCLPVVHGRTSYAGAGQPESGASGSCAFMYVLIGR